MVIIIVIVIIIQRCFGVCMYVCVSVHARARTRAFVVVDSQFCDVLKIWGGGRPPFPDAKRSKRASVGLLMSSPVDHAAATVPAVPLTLENPHVGSAESRVA